MADNEKAVGVNVSGGSAAASRDIAGRDINYSVVEQAAPASPTALHQLPPPPSDFTGRTKEIAEMLAAMQPGAAAISGTHGMGGVGKTALALVLAQRLTSRYPDAQIYLDLKDVSQEPLNPRDAMEHVIRAYHPADKLPENEAQLHGLYRTVLHDQRALILMDNARDRQQVEPLIPPPGCLLLVTSRQHFVLPGLVEKNLYQLPPEDAHALLVRIAPRLQEESTDKVAELARLCGYLPQALRAVASALAVHVDISPHEYAQRLSDARARLTLTETDASLQVSYDLLTQEQQKSFRALAVFPGSFDPAGAATIWSISEDAAKTTLSNLLRCSMVEFNEVSKRYRLHDLIHDFADSKLQGDERLTAQRRHAVHYKGVLAAADGLFLMGGESQMEGLALFDLERGNIEDGQSWAAGHPTEEQAAELCSEYYGAGIHCLFLRLHPRSLIPWGESALAGAQRLGQRRVETRCLGNLGSAYWLAGQYPRAIELYQKSLAIARETSDRIVELKALGNLGNAYSHLGNYSVAADYGEQCLRIAREISDRRAECVALGNLGDTYRLKDDPQRAVEFHNEQLIISREIGDRQIEGNALGNLGVDHHELGEAQRAIEFQDQSLSICREVGNRRGEAMALGNLGNTYSSLGDHRRAVEFHQQDRQVAREIGDLRGEGTALRNMSEAYESLGERGQAIACLEAALTPLEEIGHPRIGEVRASLRRLREGG